MSFFITYNLELTGLRILGMGSTHLLGTRVGKTVSGPGDGVASKPSGVPAPRVKNQQARDVIAGGGNSESRRKSKASLGGR